MWSVQRPLLLLPPSLSNPRACTFLLQPTNPDAVEGNKAPGAQGAIDPVKAAAAAWSPNDIDVQDSGGKATGGGRQKRFSKARDRMPLLDLYGRYVHDAQSQLDAARASRTRPEDFGKLQEQVTS